MSTSNKICKDGASKLSSSDDVCEMSDMLQNMSTTADKDIVVSVCANCGKEGIDVNNICNKCKLVKYCNASCKKKHRHKHKKECEDHVRLAAEHAAKLHDIELFKQPPPLEDCPICFLQLPTLKTGWRYQTCCGKVICSGCLYAPLYDNQGNTVDNEKCPFCRVPTPSSNEEILERVHKRNDAGDDKAIHGLGISYRDGRYGLPQDYTKSLELYHRSAELGHAAAYASVGYAYDHGKGVEIDKKKAVDYYELAATRGDIFARHNLGIKEENGGNTERALKHYMISAKGGYSYSLNRIKELYSNGHATKEDYNKALQLYQEYLGEIKSKQRDEAAAAREDYRYY